MLFHSTFLNMTIKAVEIRIPESLDTLWTVAPLASSRNAMTKDAVAAHRPKVSPFPGPSTASRIAHSHGNVCRPIQEGATIAQLRHQGSGDRGDFGMMAGGGQIWPPVSAFARVRPARPAPYGRHDCPEEN